MKAGQQEPEGLTEQVPPRSARLEEQAGKRLGDTDDPLLVSVRSGARESMPGMMDTVLNLGLNDESVEGLARKTGNERFAWDSYRRFVQMFGNVCRGVPGEQIEDAIKEQKEQGGRQARHRARRRRPEGARRPVQGALPRQDRRGLPRRTRASSCAQAIRAVFDSWMASAPSSTAASTASPTSGARR